MYITPKKTKTKQEKKKNINGKIERMYYKWIGLILLGNNFKELIGLSNSLEFEAFIYLLSCWS
jgi:hypothetical protein